MQKTINIKQNFLAASVVLSLNNAASSAKGNVYRSVWPNGHPVPQQQFALYLRSMREP
jgi:hypothetical protein